MHPAEWIALVPSVLLGGGGAVGVIVRLTRLIVAVEGLCKAMERVAGKVEEHERRLTQGGL